MVQAAGALFVDSEGLVYCRDMDICVYVNPDEQSNSWKVIGWSIHPERP